MLQLDNHCLKLFLFKIFCLRVVKLFELAMKDVFLTPISGIKVSLHNSEMLAGRVRQRPYLQYIGLDGM